MSSFAACNNPQPVRSDRGNSTFSRFPVALHLRFAAEGRVQPRQHVPGREVLIEGVLRVVDRDSPVGRNPGTFVSATRRLIRPTNASVTLFHGAASRHLFSCRCNRHAPTRPGGSPARRTNATSRCQCSGRPTRILHGGNPINIKTVGYVMRCAYFLDCRSARTCEVVSPFRSQFHANFHNAESNLTLD